jgi:hypothetical protein
MSITPTAGQRRAKQIRALRQRSANQQSTVAAAANRELRS